MNLSTSPWAQTPAGTAITHQGSLEDLGSPATGAYDFEFALFDTDSAGTQIGATLSHDDVAVLDGLYNVALDFGAGAKDSERKISMYRSQIFVISR